MSWLKRSRQVKPLPLLTMGHPLLRRVSSALTAEELASSQTASQVQRMRATMAAYGDGETVSAGLAAPQVGWMKRVVVVSVDVPYVPETVLYNPEWEVEDATPILMQESCMSVPGLVAVVERARRVRVSYVTADNEPRALTADGWVAGLLQHELDHLDGVLLVDRTPSKNLAYVDQYMEHVYPKLEHRLETNGSIEFKT